MKENIDEVNPQFDGNCFIGISRMNSVPCVGAELQGIIAIHVYYNLIANR